VEGAPLLCIPFHSAQPAVAAQLALGGAAEVLGHGERTADKVRGAVVRMLTDPAYGRAAEALGARVLAAGGGPAAAAAVVQVASEGGWEGKRRRRHVEAGFDAVGAVLAAGGLAVAGLVVLGRAAARGRRGRRAAGEA
jgi:hypothetical protein